jgi:hypothetical protein
MEMEKEKKISKRREFLLEKWHGSGVCLIVATLTCPLSV